MRKNKNCRRAGRYGDSGSFFAYVDEKNTRIHAEIKVAFLLAKFKIFCKIEHTEQNYENYLIILRGIEQWNS